MDDKTLLPCPFCGGAPKSGDSGYGYWQVYCPDSNLCDVSPSSEGATEADAVAAWNARAPQTTRIEALEDTLPPVGANGLYVCDGLGLSCTVIGHVEGWLEVKFHNDQSTCIVRPSRFNPRGSQS